MHIIQNPHTFTLTFMPLKFAIPCINTAGGHIGNEEGLINTKLKEIYLDLITENYTAEQ